DGTYIFGDFGTSRVWASRVQNDSLVNLTEIATISRVVSFDRDKQGRILVTTHGNTNNGRILLLESPDMAVGPVSVKAKTREALKPIAVRTVMADPARYELMHLDGTKAALGTLASGTYLVREKGVAGAARVMTIM